MSGWKQFGYDFNELYKQDIEKGTMKEGALIMTDYWFPAAHLDYYVAHGQRDQPDGGRAFYGISIIMPGLTGTALRWCLARMPIILRSPIILILLLCLL